MALKLFLLFSINGFTTWCALLFLSSSSSMTVVGRASDYAKPKLDRITPVVPRTAAVSAGVDDRKVNPTSTSPSFYDSRQDHLRRSSFPEGFLFGAATSSYQIEGCPTEGGKGPSIWDAYTHEHPEKIVDGSNGDIAIDFCHRYKEDIDLLHDMGMDVFRFSISWPRILPNGSLRDGISKEGIQFYNNIIDALVEKGLQPFVTLFQWEIPQSLEQEYHSFLSHRIVEDYRDFVDICFREFGDRVKYWITFNEPSNFCLFGYSLGYEPPERCSPWQEGNCATGNSAIEPYIVGHNILLAHGAAAQLYRNKYQKSQGGQIGITLYSTWFESYSDTKFDNDAARRAQDFTLGWFLDPLTQGDYPFIMRALVGDRLPRFTETQAEMIKGSIDFIGLNYYTSSYAQHVSILDPIYNSSYELDSYTSVTGERSGNLIGPPSEGLPWLKRYPQGLEKLLLFVKDNYGNIPIYITENGTNEKNKKYNTLYEALADDKRIDYHKGHLYYLKEALDGGVNVKGYIVWSLLDNFEWNSGYTVRFGLIYIDYENDLKRHPKKSYYWFRSILTSKF